ELYNALKDRFRVKLDDSDQSPGWKYAEYEMKGVPVRIEIGPRDIEAGQCVCVTRHNLEKAVVALDGIEDSVAAKLQEVRDGMYAKALENREKRTYACKTLDEINEALAKNGDGFVKAMWCGEEECEDGVKAATGIGSRCIPLEQETVGDVCVCCGKPAKQMVIWARAY
ncbi:MAG: proline--tRNA ligase, partial [Clostridia bacterium]|nr:proline--tRNA ligase [Clostridia bacterium]